MNQVQSGVIQFSNTFRDAPYPIGFLEAYDLQECLAQGHGTETFLVSSKQNSVLLIAKCYDKSIYTSVHEDEILLNLHHPGLPAYVASFENKRYSVTVREYVEGTPLDKYATENRITEPQACKFCIQLCEILSYLHGQDQPVIHRDIKPQNIIVKRDGTISLIDFDIARRYSDSAESDTQFLGTRIYAPPEQYGFAQTDCRTDIYALGILLRFLLTGSEKEQPGQMVSRRMKRVIDRCSAFSPKDRYTNAAAVRKALLRSCEEQRRKTVYSVCAAAGALALLSAGFLVGRYTTFLLPGEAVSSITFQEPLIEAAVRAQLGKTDDEPITTEELTSVRSLYIFGTMVAATREPFENGLAGDNDYIRGDIDTLDDLAMLPNIENLQISYQNLEDASGLASLKHPVSINLMHTRIHDISMLAGNQSLEALNLYDTNVSDTACLNSCPRLNNLDLGRTLVKTLDEVGGMDTLTSLTLSCLRLDTLSGIERFSMLETLRLTDTEVTVPDPCEEPPELESIYANGTLYDQLKNAFAGSGVAILEN